MFGLKIRDKLTRLVVVRNMKRIILGILGLLVVGAVGWAGVFWWQNLRGVAPALESPARNIADLLPASNESSPVNGSNQTNFPLKLPAGFTVSVFAKDLPLARVMLFDAFGNLWVSRTRAGAIAMLEIKDGRVARQSDVLRNLKNPHGLALDPENPSMLYFAEEDRISRVPLYSDGAPEKIVDLPFGAGHSTRTLLFGADGRLYVSIGSSCNVCVEKDERRAAVFSLNKDGSDFREFARGLRNSVFLVSHPKTGQIWATEMGRDLLGDDVPPEEINILQAGRDYGWPYCYSQNVHDDAFDPQNRLTCQDKQAPFIEMQAHSAPLGLAFVPEDSNWPAEYKNNLLVAFHGSWNRSTPTGYKIVRFKLDRDGKLLTEQEDFLSGWLSDLEALGRPVGIIFQGNAMYVSDDKAGVIYRVVYTGQ